jgi:hypothetical protein
MMTPCELWQHATTPQPLLKRPNDNYNAAVTVSISGIVHMPALHSPSLDQKYNRKALPTLQISGSHGEQLH